MKTTKNMIFFVLRTQDRRIHLVKRLSSGASPLPAANSYLILNIPSGFSRPHPCLLFAIPQSTAFCIRRIFTSLFDSHGSLERSKAIVPDTIGVAIDVPQARETPPKRVSLRDGFVCPVSVGQKISCFLLSS